MIDDEANKQHSLLDKKLSPTFDKYLSLIVYKAPPTPLPPSEFSINEHASESRYLAAAGRRRLSLRLNFGVSSKLRTSGETATEGVTCFAIESHFHLLGSGLSVREGDNSEYNSCFSKHRFFFNQISNFLTLDE